jgi:rhodanese-related sulfurtransferase
MTNERESGQESAIASQMGSMAGGSAGVASGAVVEELRGGALGWPAGH